MASTFFIVKTIHNHFGALMFSIMHTEYNIPPLNTGTKGYSPIRTTQMPTNVVDNIKQKYIAEPNT